MVQSAQSTFEVCHEITSYQYQRAELGVMLIDGDLNPVLPAPPPSHSVRGERLPCDVPGVI